MVRWSWPAFIGFGVPLILLAVNLALGYGGLLALILVLIWLGTAIILVLPEDATT